MDNDFEYRPTGRPLAEPPIFDYEESVMENKIPSDARLRRLFEKDIAMGYRYRDALTEEQLLLHHKRWAWELAKNEEDEGRRFPYKRLKEELIVDIKSVEESVLILKEAKEAGIISELGFWEYKHLDDDGGTLEIQLMDKDDIELCTRSVFIERPIGTCGG